MCIGCGVCSIASSGAIPVTISSRRLYQADLTSAPPDALRAASRVCPFSDESPNEDAIVAAVNPETPHRHPLLGSYTSISAGRVNDDEYVVGSSSGGLTSWLLSELIQQDVVDAIINVGRPGPAPELVGYGSTTSASDRERRKSHYYAATMAEALTIALSTEKRFALVGVPCFIKAARALCLEKPEVKERLVVFIGLVCGHYKTQAYAESLAWQLGIPPDDLADVDFRIKRPGRPSSEYLFGARHRAESEWRTAPMTQLAGGHWGHNAFQPEACNFCDDVVGETADVSFGDAWLDEFTADPRGTNIVISRDRRMDSLLQAGRASREITLHPLDPNDAVQSQAGGFRHRREGLAIRLSDDLRLGLSVPQKRVRPDSEAVTKRRANLLRFRRRMAMESHRAFDEAVASGDLNRYLGWIRERAKEYQRRESPPHRRMLRNVRRIIARFKRTRTLSR